MQCKNGYIIIKPDSSDRTTNAGIQMPDIPENEIAIWTGTVISADDKIDIKKDTKVVYSKIMAQRWVKDLEELAVVHNDDIIAYDA